MSPTKRHLSTNLIWNLSVGPVVLLGSLGVVSLAIRAAGGYAYGVWAVCFGLVVLASQLDLGIGTVLIRFGSLHRSRGEMGRVAAVQRYARNRLGVCAVALGAILGAVLWVYLFLTDPGVFWPPMVVVSALSIVFGLLSRYYFAVLQSAEIFHPERLSGLISIVLRALLIVVGPQLLSWDPIWLVVAGDSAAVVTSLAFARIFCAKYGLLQRAVEPLTRAERRSLSKFGLAAFVSAASGLATTQIPLYFVGALVGFKDAAVFSAFMRVAVTARISFSWVLSPLLPRITANIDNRQALTKIYSFAMWLLSIMTIFYVTILVVSGGYIAELWLGPEYSGYGVLVGIIGLITLVASIFAVQVTFATALGKPLYSARLGVSTLVLATSLSGILPLWIGVTGAGLAILLPNLIALVLVSKFASRVLRMPSYRDSAQIVVVLITSVAVAFAAKSIMTAIGSNKFSQDIAAPLVLTIVLGVAVLLQKSVSQKWRRPSLFGRSTVGRESY